MSSLRNEYRVNRVPQHSPRDAKWIVSSNGTYVQGYSTKNDAVSRARKLAKQHSPSALVIEYEGGGIANKVEYG